MLDTPRPIDRRFSVPIADIKISCEWEHEVKPMIMKELPIEAKVNMDNSGQYRFKLEGDIEMSIGIAAGGLVRGYGALKGEYDLHGGEMDEKVELGVKFGLGVGKYDFTFAKIGGFLGTDNKFGLSLEFGSYEGSLQCSTSKHQPNNGSSPPPKNSPPVRDFDKPDTWERVPPERYEQAKSKSRTA